MRNCKHVAEDLLAKYNCYETVYFDFILNAVCQTKEDMGAFFEKASLAVIHRHIIENYI